MTQFPYPVTVEITHFGVNTAGEVYSLECNVNGTTSFINFQWMDHHATRVINNDSITITNSATHSLLQFSPLYQSHGGTYTCRATIDGSTESKSANLNVNGIFFALHTCVREEEELLILDVIRIS